MVNPLERLAHELTCTIGPIRLGELADRVGVEAGALDGMLRVLEGQSGRITTGEVVPVRTRSRWYTEPSRFGKAGHFQPERWFGYVTGENPGFPDQVLDDTCRCMIERLEAIDTDDWSQMESWDVHQGPQRDDH